MRLGGRLNAAIDIIEDIAARHRPASLALKDWGASNRFAGSGDRAAIGNFVYDALRRKRSASKMLGGDTARAQVFGAALLEGGHDPAGLDGAFDGDRFAPEPLTAAEKSAIADFDPEKLPALDRADIQDWCETPLAEIFGKDWVAEAAALAARPPLDIRINTLKAGQEKVLAQLERHGARPSRLTTNGLRIAPIAGSGRHPNIQAEPAFRKGWFEVQDEGSQIAAQVAAAGPARQVLDYCAGAGGKTLALSATLENHGQIFAFDADKHRLAPIFDRLQRAGSRNVQVLSEPEALFPLEGRMDLVLVDAPCTGSGTWRRRPDAKWRLTDRQLAARIAEQKDILAKARKFVSPGGQLAYVTCSVFAPENTGQIADFLAANPDFTPVDHQTVWNERFPDHTGDVRAEPEGLLLSPLRTDTDGFFISVLQHSSNK